MKLVVNLNPAWRRHLSVSDRRFWLLRSAALSIDIQTESRWRVEIYYKRLLLALAVLALGFHLAAATGLKLWLDRNPYNQVGWADLALPWRWGGLRAKQGDAAIAQGKDSLRQRNFGAAYGQFRAGLARAPANTEGRLQLARLTAGYEPVRALQLMEEGVAYAPANVAFWRGLVALYLFNEAYTRGLAAVDRALAASPAPGLTPEVKDSLITARTQLLMNAGRPADALQALAAAASTPPRLRAERDARRLLEVAALTAVGRAKDALALLDREGGATTGASPEALRVEAEACVAAGADERLRGVLVRLRAAQPGNPAFLAYAFECWHRLQRGTPRDQAEAEFHRYFAGNDRAQQVFALALANLGHEEALVRLRNRAVVAGLSAFAFNVNLTELNLRRGDLQDARRHLRDWEGGLPTLAANQSFHPKFVHRLTLAAAADSDGPIAALLSHLQENRPQVRPGHYRFAADTLIRAGSLDGADRVLKMAQAHYVHSDPLAAAQVALAAKRAAKSGEAFARVPATAEAALAAFDAELARGALPAARALIDGIRQANPTWLAEQQAAVAAREIALTLATGGTPAGRALVRNYFTRHTGDTATQELLALTRKLVARGRMADARLLHDEIKTARGQSPAIAAALAALRLPDEWQELLAGRDAALRALDDWLNAGQWAEAARLLARLQDSPPKWAAEAQVELRVRQVRLSLGVGRTSVAQMEFRRLIMSAGPPRAAAFRLVREYVARGERATALTLAQEADLALRDDPAVEKLLREVRLGPPPQNL